MKVIKLIVSAILVMAAYIAIGQEKAVEAKGIGVNRDDALQDALRNAIGQAVGVSLASESQVENFMIIRDAISTNTRGYITGYDVISETKLQSGYEMVVSARVKPVATESRCSASVKTNRGCQVFGYLRQAYC
ncbi:MAG: hypothetical protein ACNA7V_10755 [Bacteroidales bacterium]